MSDVWVHLGGADYELFGDYEALWLPKVGYPSPLVPGSSWLMAAKHYAWLAERLKALSINAYADIYCPDDLIMVMIDERVAGRLSLTRRGEKKVHDVTVLASKDVKDTEMVSVSFEGYFPYAPRPKRLPFVEALKQKVDLLESDNARRLGLAQHVPSPAELAARAEGMVNSIQYVTTDEPAPYVPPAPWWRRVWRKIRS